MACKGTFAFQSLQGRGSYGASLRMQACRIRLYSSGRGGSLWHIAVDRAFSRKFFCRDGDFNRRKLREQRRKGLLSPAVAEPLAGRPSSPPEEEREMSPLGGHELSLR